MPAKTDVEMRNLYTDIGPRLRAHYHEISENERTKVAFQRILLIVNMFAGNRIPKDVALSAWKVVNDLEVMIIVFAPNPISRDSVADQSQVGIRGYIRRRQWRRLPAFRGSESDAIRKDQIGHYRRSVPPHYGGGL